jgi:hypothetical protein
MFESNTACHYLPRYPRYLGPTIGTSPALTRLRYDEAKELIASEHYHL